MLKLYFVVTTYGISCFDLVCSWCRSFGQNKRVRWKVDF